MEENFIKSLEKNYGTSSMPYLNNVGLDEMTEEWFLSKLSFLLNLFIHFRTTQGSSAFGRG